MKIIYLGIDLAKNVFAVHGIDESGRAALVRPHLRREQLLELIATLPPCVIGMKPAQAPIIGRAPLSGSATRQD
jgi:transposase